MNENERLMYELRAAESTIASLRSELEQTKTKLTAAIEDSARAENDARDREAVLSEQLNDYIDKCKDAEERVEEWKKKAEEASSELNSVLDSKLEGYRALGDRAANAENERDDALVALRALAERVETMQKMLLAWCAGDSHWGDMTLRDASLATLAEQGIELPRISPFLHDGTKGDGK